jgi:hypothetical protein
MRCVCWCFCVCMYLHVPRCPSFAEKTISIIDSLHHTGHKNCSPLYNHKWSLCTSFVNAEMNEQMNKPLRFIQTSVAFLGQIRAIVFIRCDHSHVIP